MTDIFIFGASGFARETADVAIANGYAPVFVVREKAGCDDLSDFGRVIAEDELNNHWGADCAIGIADVSIRRRIVESFGSAFRFPALIHPLASFGHRQREVAEASEGTIICAGARFESRITMGRFGVFNLNSTTCHDSIVEDFCHVAPGANLSGYVHLQGGVWIGTGAAINQGSPQAHRKIGRNTMIGSGAVVVHDCDADSVYVGVPARKRA